MKPKLKAEILQLIMMTDGESTVIFDGDLKFKHMQHFYREGIEPTPYRATITIEKWGDEGWRWTYTTNFKVKEFGFKMTNKYHHHFYGETLNERGQAKAAENLVKFYNFLVENAA